MTCIIVDDENVSREILNFLCEKEPGLEVVGNFSNAMDAFRFLNQEEVDLIFLDIHMPGFTGFDFVQTLKNAPYIILTSSDQNSAVKAFEFESIVDFLSKPLNHDRFRKSIQKVEKLMKSKSSSSASIQNRLASVNQFFINIDKRLIKLNAEDVNLIEAQGDYSFIKLENKDYKVHSSLSKIREKLPSDTFFQVHRSYIINLKKIIDIQDNTVLIHKSVIPISRSKRAELMGKLNLI